MSEQEKETVYIASSRGQSQIHHKDKDCESCHFDGELREVRKQRVSNYRKCKTCYDIPYEKGKPNADHVCPFCGEVGISQLAKHLVGCDEA